MATGVAVAPASVNLEALLSLDIGAWDEAPETSVSLTPTPLERQPSAYVQTAWRDRQRSGVGKLTVQALNSTEVLGIRLEWAVPQPRHLIDDINVYADACAVLFPADGRTAEFATMGSEDAPIVGWYWRAGADQAFSISARGIGTVERDGTHALQTHGRWSNGRWQVVLGQPLPMAFDCHAAVPVAFAVWQGADSERAGLKSYSLDPIELRFA